MFECLLWHDGTSLVAQMVKHLPTVRETWVRSLGREDSLEKEMATHSSTLALKIPWTEVLGAGYYPCGRKESGTTSLHHDVNMICLHHGCCGLTAFFYFLLLKRGFSQCLGSDPFPFSPLKSSKVKVKVKSLSRV